MNSSKSPPNNNGHSKSMDLIKSIFPTSLKYISANSGSGSQQQTPSTSTISGSPLSFLSSILPSNSSNTFNLKRLSLSPNANSVASSRSSSTRAFSSTTSNSNVTHSSKKSIKSPSSTSSKQSCASDNPESVNSYTVLSSSISCDSSVSDANSNTNSFSSNSSNCSHIEEKSIVSSTNSSLSYMNTSDNSTACTSATNSTRVTRSSKNSTSLSSLTMPSGSSIRSNNVQIKTNTNNKRSLSSSINSIKRKVPDTNYNTNTSAVEARVKCGWEGCHMIFKESDESFLDHVKTKHILTQRSNPKYKCLWRGCSVYNNASVSFPWLERHVIDHFDQRPFKCIFKDCNKEFRTEQLREKHVQTHISEPPKDKNSNSKSFSSNNQTNKKDNGISSCNILLSPCKTRNELLKAKQAIIENIKNKSLSNLQINNKNNDLNQNNINNSSNHSMINQTKKLTQSASTSSLTNSATATITTSNNSNKNSNNNNNNTINQLANYTQILKTLTTKKRKNTTTNGQNDKNAAAKFKKAQFKDYIDPITVKVILKRFQSMNYKQSTGTFTFNAKIISSKTDSNNVERFLVEWQPSNIIKNEWLERSQITVTKTLTLNELFRKDVLAENNPFNRRQRFRANKRK